MLRTLFGRKKIATELTRANNNGRSTPSAYSPAFVEKIAEVPRYPPFKRGIPFLSSDLCLAQHSDLLDRLRITLRFTKEEFDEFAVPPLKRFADYVHLLPASKNHHHRAAGGLLRHSLEVALYAGMSAGGRVFGAEETMKVRTLMRRQYIYAAFILGLGHDVGKAFSDMIVTSKSDNATWNPYTQSLADWCKEHVPEDHRYLVKFHQKRTHKHHEVFSTFALNFILGPEAIQFLTASGLIMEPLESVIAVTSDTGRIKQFSNADELSKILKLAEKKSCDRDMKGKMDVLGMETSETPFPEHIVAKINHLLHEEFMSANSPKSRLFIVNSQAFVAWDQAFADILFYEFQKDAISIPKDADTLLGAMVDFGLAHIEKDPTKRPQVKVRHKSGISHVFNVIELDAGAFSDLFEEVIDTGCSVEVVYSKQPSDNPLPPSETPTDTENEAAEEGAPPKKNPVNSSSVDKKKPKAPAKKKGNATAGEKQDTPGSEKQSPEPPDNAPVSDSTNADNQGLDDTFNPQQFLEDLIAANTGEGEKAKPPRKPKNGKKGAANKAIDEPGSDSPEKEATNKSKKRAPRKPKTNSPSGKVPADKKKSQSKKTGSKAGSAPNGKLKAESSGEPHPVEKKHGPTLNNAETESAKSSEDLGATSSAVVSFFEMVKNGQVGEQFEVERTSDAYHVIAVPNKLYAYLGKVLELPPYRVRSLLTHAYENEPDGIDSIRIIVPIGGPQKS